MLNQRDLAIKNAKLLDPDTCAYFSESMIDCEDTRAKGIPTMESCLRNALAKAGYEMSSIKLIGLIQAARSKKAEKADKAAAKKADKAAATGAAVDAAVGAGAAAAAASTSDAEDPGDIPVVLLSDDEGDKERETAEPDTAEVSAQADGKNKAQVAMQREPLDVLDEDEAMAQ